MKQRVDSGKQQRQNLNWDSVGNDLESFKSRVHERWQDLSDTQIDSISGRREKLSQEIQNTYGLSRDEAENQIRDFESGQPNIAGASGRGQTERSREFGAGNQQGGDRTNLQ